MIGVILLLSVSYLHLSYLYTCTSISCKCDIYSYILLENLAENPEYKGQASQSLSYRNSLYNAENAVDGHFETDGSANTCSFTVAGISYRTAWWKLSLKLTSNVAFLKIFFRSSSKMGLSYII